MHTAEIDRWYAEFLVVRIVDGVRRAFANLAPAQIEGDIPDRMDIAALGQVIDREVLYRKHNVVSHHALLKARCAGAD